MSDTALGIRRLATELGVSLGDKTQEEYYEFYAVDRLARQAADKFKTQHAEIETLKARVKELEDAIFAPFTSIT